MSLVISSPVAPASAYGAPASTSSSGTAGAATGASTGTAAIGTTAKAGSTSTPASSTPPSSTVTLSAQAQAALGHASGAAPAASGNGGGSATASEEPSVYESMKNGLSDAVDDVESAASASWHWLANGVESAVSAVDTMAHGIVDLPFVAVGAACDAAGAVLDAL